MQDLFVRDAINRSDCILASQIVSGNADFFSLPSGLTLRLLASSSTPFSYDIARKRYTLRANVDLTVTDNAHNFIWIDSSGVTGRVATPCTYAFTAPAGPATNDHWFDLGSDLMKSWNGSAWVTTAHVFIGYVRADSAAINARYACEPIAMSPEMRWRMFGDGGSGFLDLTTSDLSLFPVSPKRQTAIVMRGNSIMRHGSNVIGLATVLCQGIFIMLDTAIVDLNDRGRAGFNGGTGTGGNGQSSGFGGCGGGGGGGTSAGGAGGTGIMLSATSFLSQAAGGTAGGGAGGSGTATAMLSFSFSRGQPITFLYGHGGGAGGGSGAANGGNGRAGGGGVNILCSTLALGSGTIIRSNGTDGDVGPGVSRGAGGAGGGGCVQLFYRNFFNNGTLQANGGTGGASGGAGSGAGGNGGLGLVSSTVI